MTGSRIPRSAAWVLRNARECAADQELRRPAGLARALGVHRSQIGRWEQGRSELRERRVLGYETALGLPPATLVCALDIVSRDLAPVRGRPTLAVDLPQDPAGEALSHVERGLSDDGRLSGRDWTRLAALLAACPDVVLRREDWTALVHRPLVEMAVTHGLENSLRWEATARLVAHPRCPGVAARLADEALGNPRQQLFADYTALVQYTDDPAGLTVMLDHLRTDLTDDRLWAVLLCLGTLARRPANRERVRAAGPRLLELFLDPARSIRVRRAAAGVLRIVDRSASQRLTAALSGREAGAARLLHQGSAHTLAELRDLHRQIDRALVEADLPNGDPTFRALLRRATNLADEDSRGNALALLGLTAQGAVVGRVHGDWLRTAVESADDDLAGEHLATLCWLAQPTLLDLLTELATTTSASARLAGYALGNCLEEPGPRREDRDRRLLAAATSGLGDAAGITYAMALRGRFDHLEQLRRRARRTSRQHTAEWSDKAAWWLQLPHTVRELAATSRAAATTLPTR